MTLISENNGRFIVPGFVDTHIHGAFGVDTCDASAEGIVKLSKNLLTFGVTSFCPTTMTVGEDVIRGSFEAVAEAKSILEKSDEPYAKILGIHLEGPFLAPSKAGVQDSSSIVNPEDGFKLINSLESDFPGLLKIIDIAPELKGSMEFIEEFSSSYVISLAHTDADYDLATKAFEKGAKSVTHILNAMSSTSKRNPGVLGAAYDFKDVYCEIISDGMHIDKTILRMLFDLIREDRTIIVSDSMRGAGMPDGIYKLATADVEVKGGRTYFGEHGGLAGSVTNIGEEVMKLHSYGVDPLKIIRSATVNPLNRLGLNSEDVYGKNYLDEKFSLISTEL